ncbi:DUF6673 family protein [Terrisporobacter glycolicus]|uniref:DUF6673 domain-containing protein n=1 Tax=Terrisporobacter glycolicus ATCC 14880 = DSM 1288 TaxID=1121315 RepID=A0ABZ2EWJ9_9FIRM|nr:DUF6673 family protein [Terrisporobacter glycolicus]
MILKINNEEIELDFDVYDVDTSEKYEDALKEVIQGNESLEDNASTSQIIREQCKLVFKFFNDIFGEGTDKDVFGDKVNLRICLDALEQVIANANTQVEGMKNRVNKYSPNRAQRRKKM